MAATVMLAAMPWRGAWAQSLTPQSAPSQSAQPVSASEAAMQAEIAALKAENREFRKRRDRPATARAAAAAPLTTPSAAASSLPPRAPVRPADAYAMASGALSIWTGAYMGVSLGAGGMRASTSGSGNSSTQFFGPPPTLETTSFAFGGNGRFNAGAVADLYAGYSRQWGNWVGGVQGEAGLGRIFSRFDLNGSGNSNGVITNTAFQQTNSLNINFMVSALGRVGYLIDPRNQIYGLAGWTFAGFSTTLTPLAVTQPFASFFGSSFGANGVTVGAGWEHQIAEQWTLRAEYRYTKFENVALSSSFLATSPGQSVTGQAGQSNATISSPNLQVVRVGLTRYFDAGVLPAGIFTKALATYAASWTGAYAGVSVGLGGENTRATTNSSSPSTTSGGFNSTTSSNILEAGDRQFGAGGNADLFIGYNKQINDWVVGGQLEGTLARFNERLSRTVTRNTVETILGGVTTVPPTTVSGSKLDTLSQNWAVTAAARFGRLVTPHDLIYGIAGWSFANFSTSLEGDNTGAEDRTFNTSGPTVGIGWERQLADQWSIRAEYRYTHFLDKTLSTSSSDAFDNAGNVNTSSSTSQTNISADSHIVRFGVARAFGG